MEYDNEYERYIPTPQHHLALEGIILFIFVLLIIIIVYSVTYKAIKREPLDELTNVSASALDIARYIGYLFIAVTAIIVIFYMFLSFKEHDYKVKYKRMIVFSIVYVLSVMIIYITSTLLVKLMDRLLIQEKDKDLAAIKYALYNDTWCKVYCPELCQRPVIDAPPFTSIPLTWSCDMAAYCIDMIFRVAGLDKATLLVPPQGMKLDVIFNGLSGSKPVAVFVNEGDDTKQIVWFVARGGGKEQWLGYTASENVKDPFKDASAETSAFANVPLNHLLDGNGLTPILPADLTVNTGMWKIYTAIRGQWLDYIDTLPANPNRQFVFTGHSSGCGYSTFAAYDASIAIASPTTQYIIYNFGSPMLMNYDLSPIVNSFWRIYNKYDIVTNLPFPVTPNTSDPTNPYLYVNQSEDGGMAFSCNIGSLYNHILQLVYAHINELKPSA